jgi:hypothetical protein
MMTAETGDSLVITKGVFLTGPKHPVKKIKSAPRSKILGIFMT